MINLQSPVQECMSTDLITVSQDTPITVIASIFKEHRVHHIPVVNFNKIVGMISKSDFLEFKVDYNTVESKYDTFRYRNHKADQIMTTGLAKLESSERIAVAIKLFEENLFHAIPIEEDGKLVGILTTYDLIKSLSESVTKYEVERKLAKAAIAS